MIYYSYDKDIFFDDNNRKLTDSKDVCEYYFIDTQRYQKFHFTKRQYKCKLLYDMIHQFEKEGTVNYTKSLDCNFLFNVYKAKIHTNFSIRASYLPVYNNEIGSYINLLTDKDEIIETVITNKKYRESPEFIEYFKLKLGLEYLALGIEKDYGYIIHCSTKNAIRTTRIDNVYNHQKCLQIINSYLNNVNTKVNIKPKDIEILKYKALKCLEKANKNITVNA